jgi:hypothetical protein
MERQKASDFCREGKMFREGCDEPPGRGGVRANWRVALIPTINAAFRPERHIIWV